jgi:arylsulfatase A-like enzyme
MRRILPSTPWLPQILQQNGYSTYAVMTDFRAFTSVETAGFDRGFSSFDTSTHLSYSGGTMRGFTGHDLVDKAVHVIDGQPADRPFFLWMHLMEPHFLYERSPRAPDFGSDEFSLYDDEIWEVDHQLAQLLKHLDEKGLLARTLIVFTGDHGEEFGEHGDRWHGSNLFQPQVHTAAFLYAPGLSPRRVRDATVLTDVTPTVLNLLGIRTGFSSLRGRNLMGLFAGGKLDPTMFVIENFTVDVAKHYMAAVVDFPHKLIYTEEGARMALYDVSQDPSELADLPRARDARVEAMESFLFEYLDKSAKRGGRRVRPGR